ncbi:histone deacetylase family protein [Mesonia maritima]|uniref:Acetoin utilization deacetylase AcuC-like enzyme n=1 Tax=Mesonia maritima TaxID=1793873 RepID=A0ABU1K1Y0_9FLAO|nr:histone deacetylase [Mesonia maritima]MDR6299615.1 acetoin utilization deacetylase AcuC-like enzyme [Mesonia maritima]
MLKIAFDSSYVYPLPPKHRFPMEKYELLPQQLLHEGTCSEENFFEPEIPNDKYILAVHDAEYYYDFLNLKLSQKEIRRTGFPLSRELVYRERLIAGGTIQAAKFALEYGIAMNIAGGTHHAYSNRGEGFCMLNDQAIAARYLQQKKLAEKILIVDLDVHQGNGTAEIFSDDDSVFTFSMHGEKNFPFKKEKSDLDIALPNETNDKEYLKILKNILPDLIEKVKPDFVFYLSGVDVLATDKLGKLSLSIEGCKKRDRFVLETLKNQNLPVECSMGGGYSEEIKHIVEAHANTYRLAQEIYF